MINTLTLSIDIKAEKSKIWQTLWDEQSYRDWASVFFEGSYAVTDNWEQGSTVMFLAPDKSGIYSLIETHIANKIMSFKHVGLVVNGEQQPIDEETKKWTGATETYSLIDGKDVVTLNVQIDVLDEHLDYMQSTFPKALEKIKSNCSV